MSTQARLDAYLAREAAILAQGQSVRFGERQLIDAELAEVRRAISDLQSQIRRETAAASGRSSLGYSVASFNGCAKLEP
jgi:hypothetical protein